MLKFISVVACVVCGAVALPASPMQSELGIVQNRGDPPMPESLDLHSQFRSFGTYENSSGVGEAPQRIHETFSTQYFKGHTDFDADRYFRQEDTLVATSVTFNLEDGTMLDVFRSPLELKDIKAIRIINRTLTNTFNLLISGDWFTTAFFVSPSLPIQPGGMFIYETPRQGISVVATTKDELIISSGVNTVAYTLELIAEKQ